MNGKGLLLAASLAASFSQITYAHEHHTDNIPQGAAVSVDPIDGVLWVHILVQIVTWGLVFPTGMVLGIIRHRFHVPLQIIGTALAVLGYMLGHAHKGRQFGPNAHRSFAPVLHFLLFAQILLGVGLKLHLSRGFLGKIRPFFVPIHGVLGKVLPVAAWVQMLFGGIAALGFCQGEHLGQCLAHFIMGSAFIGYGILLTIMLHVGQGWLKRSGRSQEFFDSMMIAAWGCVNTFTEHHWGDPWVKNDIQHTSMGIIWWAAGLVGVWLSKTRDGRPKRNLIPGIVVFITGYAMSGHPQDLEISTKIHTFFGYTLMAAGLTRIIEISFVLKDRNALSMDGSDANSFQYLPPFLLIAGGFLFMGATEEQMALLATAQITHVSYILILFSFAFILHLFVHMLIHVYAVYAMPMPTPRGGRRHRRHKNFKDGEAGDGHANGHATAPVSGSGRDGENENMMSERERQQVREAEEFELDALISDSEGEGERGQPGRRRRDEEEGKELL